MTVNALAQKTSNKQELEESIDKFLLVVIPLLTMLHGFPLSLEKYPTLPCHNLGG